MLLPDSLSCRINISIQKSKQRAYGWIEKISIILFRIFSILIICLAGNYNYHSLFFQSLNAFQINVCMVVFSVKFNYKFNRS